MPPRIRNKPDPKDQKMFLIADQNCPHHSSQVLCLSRVAVYNTMICAVLTSGSINVRSLPKQARIFRVGTSIAQFPAHKSLGATQSQTIRVDALTGPGADPGGCHARSASSGENWG